MMGYGRGSGYGYGDMMGGRFGGLLMLLYGRARRSHRM